MVSAVNTALVFVSAISRITHYRQSHATHLESRSVFLVQVLSNGETKPVLLVIRFVLQKLISGAHAPSNIPSLEAGYGPFSRPNARFQHDERGFSRSFSDMHVHSLNLHLQYCNVAQDLHVIRRPFQCLLVAFNGLGVISVEVHKASYSNLTNSCKA